MARKPLTDEQKARKREQHARWVAANPERNLEHKRRWRALNIEKARESSVEASRRFRERHPETVRERNRHWMRKWNEDNRDASRDRSKKNYAKHREQRLVQYREYRKRPDVRARDNARQRARRASNPIHKLKCYFRSCVSDLLRGKSKSSSTMDLIGCTVEHVKAHLESQFTEGMSWENYGRHGWHVDHIRPLAWFDLSIESEQRKAFHWTNLQPLWAKENMSKGARWEGKRKAA